MHVMGKPVGSTYLCRTTDAINCVAEVVKLFMDSQNIDTMPDPDSLSWFFSVEFPEHLKEFKSLKNMGNIPGSGDATFTIQSTAAISDLHLDIEHSVQWMASGAKIWIAWPGNNQRNQDIYWSSHTSSADFEFLGKKAITDMTGGIIGVVYAGDLLFLPTHWFHLVITLVPSIWVGWGKFGNGLLMLSSLYIRMKAARLRNRGRNDHESEGWTTEEEKEFDSALGYLHKELQKLGANRPNSDEAIRKSFELVWRFTEFKPESNCMERSERTKLQELVKSFVGKKRGRCKKLWPNGCFLGSSCPEGSDGTTIELIVNHMEETHGKNSGNVFQSEQELP